MRFLDTIRFNYYASFFLDFLTISSAVYLILFRSHHGLGDDSFYIHAGERLIEGLQVYVGGFRSGSFGAVTLYFLSLLLGTSLTWIIFQIANVVGVLWLCRILLPKSHYLYVSATSLIVLWSAPVREMIFDHQITGILCVLVLTSLKLIERDRHVGAGLLLMFAFDLKPHLILGLLVAIFFWMKSRKLIVVFIVSLLTAHITLDLVSHRFLEQDWIILIKSVSGGTDSIGEKVNVFVLLDRMGFSDTANSIFSWLLFIIIIFLIGHFSSKQLFDSTTFLLLCSLYFSPYNHLYDFVPIACLALSLIFVSRDWKSICLLGLLIIPQQILVVQNIALLISLLSLLAFALARETHVTFTFRDFRIGIPLLIFVYFMNEVLPFDYTALQAWTATVTVFFLVLNFRKDGSLDGLRSVLRGSQ